MSTKDFKIRNHVGDTRPEENEGLPENTAEFYKQDLIYVFAA